VFIEASMQQSEEPPNWKGGEVLFSGATNWAAIGRTTTKKKAANEEQPDLAEPHRLKALASVKIRSVASGSVACHCLAIDVNGLCYTWGRNEKGQLGHGDLVDRSAPTVLEKMSEDEVISGSCGKNHTVLVTVDGRSFTCGSNAMGQCGIGEIKKDKNVLRPMQAMVSECSKAVCGSDFTIWLCDGKLFACGCPQYGVLGDGSNHEYNANESSVKMKFDPEPTPKLIKALESRQITHVIAGSFHIMAVDSDGIPYTWGNGNYGRLGHSVQQDEMKPRPIESFLGRVRVDPKDIVMAAGGMTTFCTTVGGMLYSWGNRKPSSSDCEMYPRPFIDFQGWKIRDMSCGPGTFAVAAERSVILWGQAKNGELAKGLEGKRSCANPEKCESLEDMYTHQVACGHGFTLFLVDPEEVLLKDFPIFDPDMQKGAADNSADDEQPARKKKRTNKRNDSESENDQDDETKQGRKKKAAKKPAKARGRPQRKKRGGRK